MMHLLVRKRLAFHASTNPTMFLCCSGVKTGVRPQFAHLIFGLPRLCAATRVTAFSKELGPGALPLTMRTCSRTSAHCSLDFFLRNHGNHAFAAWKGSKLFGWRLKVHFVMARSLWVPRYCRENFANLTQANGSLTTTKHSRTHCLRKLSDAS